MRTFNLFLLAFLFVLPISMARATEQKLRVLVLTDAGGDQDDEGSLVRFLLYCNEWDLQGIIADRPKTSNQGAKTGYELARKIVDAYCECYPNLKIHKADYPTPEYIRAHTVAGYDDCDDGVQLCRRVLMADDPRPIWYANWGSDSGTTDSMKRALDQLKKELPADQYVKLVEKLHVTRNAEKLGGHAEHIALFVDPRSPDKWYQRFQALTESAGGFDVKRDVQSVGPLGKCYSIPKEGDSAAFIYLIPNGLSDPMEPSWGCWAGRFGPLTKKVMGSGGLMGLGPRQNFWWASAEDSIEGKSNRDNTISRWAVALQNDFKARMLWTVTDDYKKANHEPIVHCQNDATHDVMRMEVKPSQAVKVSAAGSSDPDGNALIYRWWQYAEPGSYRGEITIDNAATEDATVHVPADAAGRTFHIILEVADNGAPALTRYRRVVFAVAGEAQGN